MYLMYSDEFKKNKEASAELLVRAIERYCRETETLLPHVYKDKLEVNRTDKGKPYIEGFTHFSISHTDDLWCVIFSDSPCGLDVQVIKNGNFDKMAVKIFNPVDVAKVNELGEEAFFKLWCRKEAYIKATGESIFTEVPSLWSEEENLFIDEYFIKDIRLFEGCFSAICVSEFVQDFGVIKVKI